MVGLLTDWAAEEYDDSEIVAHVSSDLEIAREMDDGEGKLLLHTS